MRTSNARDAVRVLVALALAPCLTACSRKPSTAIIRDAGENGATLLLAYKPDLTGISVASPDVRLHVDRDAALAAPVLFVEYPPPPSDPAGRDVHLDVSTHDWTAARAIAFQIKPERAIKVSVSFLDRNRVAYTAWRQLSGGVWQQVRIAFDEIRPNPYFQPPGARTGAAIDVSDVGGIGFAPQDTARGRFAISQFVLLK